MPNRNVIYFTVTVCKEALGIQKYCCLLLQVKAKNVCFAFPILIIKEMTVTIAKPNHATWLVAEWAQGAKRRNCKQNCEVDLNALRCSRQWQLNLCICNYVIICDTHQYCKCKDPIRSKSRKPSQIQTQQVLKSSMCGDNNRESRQRIIRVISNHSNYSHHESRCNWSRQ